MPLSQLYECRNRFVWQVTSNCDYRIIRATLAMTTTENMYTTMSIASLGPATLSDNKGYVSKLRAVRSGRIIPIRSI